MLGILGRALTIRHVDAGSCNGCELEIHALNNPYYNIEGLGINFVASPRHADMLLVTGPVSTYMETALKRTYHATPTPKLVVAVGDCGCTGGIFGESYASLRAGRQRDSGRCCRSRMPADAGGAHAKVFSPPSGPQRRGADRLPSPPPRGKPQEIRNMSEPTPVPPTEEAKKRLREKVEKLLARDPSRSEASIVLNGRTLKYRAVAEFIPVAAGGVDDKRGEPEAAVFTTSYFHDDADPSARPVCFVFNGGPGSRRSSSSQHTQTQGSRHPQTATMPPPATLIINNHHHRSAPSTSCSSTARTGYSITASGPRARMLSVNSGIDTLAGASTHHWQTPHSS